MTLREQFEQEYGFPHYEDYTVYVEWLEDQIHIREEAAWDAARKTVVLPYNENPVLEEDFETWKYKYESIEEWRKEQ